MRVLLWPNVLWDELPEPVAPTDNNAWSEGFDALFQIGFHARAGTANGFVGHTMVPGLRVAVDGAPVTECQIWAWLAGLPLPYGEANRTPGSCSVPELLRGLGRGGRAHLTILTVLVSA
jgi:hypothetical protein